MSTSARDYLAAEAQAKAAEAAQIAETAMKAVRSLSPDERKRVDDLLNEVEHMNKRVADIDDNEKMAERIESIRGPINQPAEQISGGMGVKSLGDAFIKSDGYGSLLTGLKSGAITSRFSTGSIELPFDLKATVTTTASPIGQPSVLPGIQQDSAVALRRLTVADLLAQNQTDSGTVRYLREITNTNAASSVAEGVDKPESTITFDQVDEPVRKVATFLPVSDEMLEDEAQIRSYLDSRLSLFVQHAEEAQLLNGNGTAPDLRGILNRSGIQTATRSALGQLTGESGGSTTLGNAIYQAMAEIREEAQAEPDGIVVHPNNWTKMRLEKDTAKQYLGGGPMIGAYGNGLMAGETYWGLPVVVTSAIAENTALVGAFRTMAAVFYRNGLTVEASNSHDDFFQKNLTAIRAERRLALAVYRANAFFKITAMQTP